MGGEELEKREGEVFLKKEDEDWRKKEKRVWVRFLSLGKCSLRDR